MACVQIGELPADEREEAFEIVDGPSKWDLMLALFENSTKETGTRVVHFTLKEYENVFGSDNVSVEITCLERLCKTDTEWFRFEGTTNVFDDNKDARGTPTKVRGIFFTNRRSGTLKFGKPVHIFPTTVVFG